MNWIVLLGVASSARRSVSLLPLGVASRYAAVNRKSLRSAPPLGVASRYAAVNRKSLTRRSQETTPSTGRGFVSNAA